MNELPENLQVHTDDFIQIINECFDASFFVDKDAFRVDHRALMHGLNYISSEALEGEMVIREEFKNNEKVLDLADFFLKINTISVFLSNTLHNVNLLFKSKDEEHNKKEDGSAV